MSATTLVSCLPEGLNGLTESSLGAAGRSLVAATTRRLFLAGRSGKETAAARREGETPTRKLNRRKLSHTRASPSLRSSYTWGWPP